MCIRDRIIGEDQSASLQYVMDYSPYQLEEVDVAIATDEDDKEMNEDAETEKDVYKRQVLEA